MDFELTQHLKKMEDISGNINNYKVNANDQMGPYITDLQDTVKYKNSTTHRRAEFELHSLEKINYIKSSLFIIYCLLVLVFVYILFKNKDMKRHKKGFLLGIVVIYPYIAPPIVIYLYEMFMYLVAIVTGEIYKKTELQ